MVTPVLWSRTYRKCGTTYLKELISDDILKGFDKFQTYLSNG